jgi:hypothetical protein
MLPDSRSGRCTAKTKLVLSEILSVAIRPGSQVHLKD